METKKFERIAPGSPGVKPTWTPGAKSGVGCAISAGSKLWFSLGRGIVNEIYHPRIDHPAVRDCGFLVSGPGGFSSDEQRDTLCTTACLAAGVPAYRIENRCARGRYRIIKEIIVDHDRDVLLQRVQFEPLDPAMDLRLYAIISPRLNNQGHDNTGWLGDHRGRPMLLAQHESHCLALAASCNWLHRSVGYVGVSDAWQDISKNGGMTWEYDGAEHGHIALAGEIDLQECNGQFVLALSLEFTPEGAALNAASALSESFDAIKERYMEHWEQWQNKRVRLDETEKAALNYRDAATRNSPDRSRPQVLEESNDSLPSLYRTSLMALRVHRGKRFVGAGIASLAIPWGEARGDNAAGYHMTWVRDLAEEAMGFLASGETEEAADALTYFAATQNENGGWPQNMWLDGRPYFKGVQLDEAALPVCLLDLVEREGKLDEDQVKSLWPMARKAATFIAQRGPSTGQDRWENSGGLSVSTIATEIAALLIASRLADRFGEAEAADYLRETADLWNDCIEEWTYITDTELSRRACVEGYYVRLAPPPGIATLRHQGPLPQSDDGDGKSIVEIISPDALALVRFGLRAPDDPRIVNTLKLIDTVTRADIPGGAYWHRYNEDHYGEYPDGRPPDKNAGGQCRGRAWPLLTGERGLYEVAAGHEREARCMAAAMNACASQIGLLSEQIWDQADIPEHDLYRGRPSGSAMPLAWAHSEYIRLLRSIRDKKVFDRPLDTWKRYVQRRTPSTLALWRFTHQIAAFPAGRRLRIEAFAEGLVRFSTDGWKTTQDLTLVGNPLGFYSVDLPTDRLSAGQAVDFTFQWAGNRWEGANFHVTVDEARIPAAASAKRRSGAKAMANV